MKKSIVFKIAAAVFAAIFVFSGYNIIKILVDYAEADKLYDSVQSMYTKSVTLSTEEQTSDKEEPQKVQEPAIQVDFSALLDKNSDIVGWLYLPDTPINYPVVQAEDNDKYLRRDLDGKYLSAGTLFVDYRNSELGEEPNYIIYGHNMKNGTMFRTLMKYKEQAFYDENPVIYYLTPHKNYKIELFAGMVIPSNADIYDPSLNRSDLLEYVTEAVAKSTFKSDITPAEEDSIITLSTCSYEYDDARYIVIGRLSELQQ